MSYHHKYYDRNNSSKSSSKSSRQSVFDRLGKGRHASGGHGYRGYHSSGHENRFNDGDEYAPTLGSTAVYERRYTGKNGYDNQYHHAAATANYRPSRSYRHYDTAVSSASAAQPAADAQYAASDIIITAPVSGERVISTGHPSPLVAASFAPPPPASAGELAPFPTPTTTTWIDYQTHPSALPYPQNHTMAHHPYPLINPNYPPAAGSPDHAYEPPLPTSTRYLDGSELSQMTFTTRQHQQLSSSPDQRSGSDSYVPGDSWTRDGSHSNKRQRLESDKKSSATRIASPQPSSPPVKEQQQAAPPTGAAATGKGHQHPHRQTKGKSTVSRTSATSEKQHQHQHLPASSAKQEQSTTTTAVEHTAPEQRDTKPAQSHDRQQPSKGPPSGHTLSSMDIDVGEQSDIMLPDWSIETEEELKAREEQMYRARCQEQEERERQHREAKVRKRQEHTPRRETEAERRRQEEEERRRRQQEAEAERKRQEEEQRRQQDAEAERRRLEEEQRREAELERKRQEDKERREAEAERQRQEEDRRREAEARRQREEREAEESRRRQQEERERKQHEATKQQQQRQQPDSDHVHQEDGISRKPQLDQGRQQQHRGDPAVLENGRSEQQTKEPEDTADQALVDSLPAPWQPIKSSRGDIYYYNTETGVSTWERPEPIKVPVPAPSMDKSKPGATSPRTQHVCRSDPQPGTTITEAATNVESASTKRGQPTQDSTTDQQPASTHNANSQQALFQQQQQLNGMVMDQHAPPPSRDPRIRSMTLKATDGGKGKAFAYSNASVAMPVTPSSAGPPRSRSSTLPLSSHQGRTSYPHERHYRDSSSTHTTTTTTQPDHPRPLIDSYRPRYSSRCTSPPPRRRHG